ncbi:hypothetical protein [Novosphingobium sp.]|uniref:hypothetical protein n=1 Tax=Novosphingobium sp. TaxID=1874826 RepID=UPI002608FA29|nr:hypothetical protein [Novosphingobium sp.]
MDPYRPCPTDFRETYLRLGQDKAIEEHYRTNWRCIARWIDECGGEELRAERRAITGMPARPHLRRGNQQLQEDLHPKQEAFALAFVETGSASEAWLRSFADPGLAFLIGREARKMLENGEIAKRVRQLQEGRGATSG